MGVSGSSEVGSWNWLLNARMDSNLVSKYPVTSTTTSGVPGTTGTLAPLTPLLGGSDAFATNLSETLIFMAPTVIDPSADNQPHSAFRQKQRRNVVK